MPSTSSANGGGRAANRSTGRPRKKWGGRDEGRRGGSSRSSAPLVWRSHGERPVGCHTKGRTARNGRRGDESRREEGLGPRQDVRGHHDRALPPVQDLRKGDTVMVRLALKDNGPAPKK